VRVQRGRGVEGEGGEWWEGRDKRRGKRDRKGGGREVGWREKCRRK
jgi:hypothetical protein